MTTSAPDGYSVTLRMLTLRRRLAAFVQASNFAAIPTLGSLIVLLIAYAPGAPVWPAAAWTAMAGLVLLTRVVVGLRIDPRGGDAGALERQWRWVNGVLVAGSIAWSVSLPLLALVARDSDRTTFAIIGAVLFSGVLLLHRSAPAAAVFHIVSMGAGLATAQYILLGQEALPLAILIGLYAVTLIIAVRVQDRSFIAATRAELQRSESEARVRAMLSEHEQQGRAADDLARIEDRVRTMANIDPLTGLGNRHMFGARLRQALEPGETQGDQRSAPALLALDLDDFRAINDLYGSVLGDAVLRETAALLSREMADEDLIARVAGDGFVVLVTAPAGDAMLIERAHRLLAAVRGPLPISGAQIRLSAGIGIARAAIGETPDELLRRADLALHAAKAKGRDQIALFDDDLDQRARERRQLEVELGEAVGRDELVLHYQPIVSLENGAIVGYEALLRWQHPTRGLLPPDRFLPIAEATGLIGAMGDWVVRRALTETAQWRGDFRLAINLSASQVRNPLLLPGIDAALAQSGFPAHRLEFEITEHTLFNDGAMLERLRTLGAEIALDDFGTGYSSLSYLRRFRFDRVKIDRSFVADVETSSESQAIVAAITRLAAALGMRITAEGVETPGQLDLLRQLGCDEAQGFLILEPMPAHEIEARRSLGAGKAMSARG